MLDVDFVISAELGTELASGAGWEALARRIRAGSAVVLPAFETPFDATGAWQLDHPPEAGRAVALAAQAGGKQAAVESFRNGTLLVFKAGEGGNFYEPTQHKRWAQSNDYFPISYSPSYEPDMILARALHPWYDERFVGYGWDKMGLPECLFFWGGSFVVHPHGFVVHVPHERSTTFHAYMKDGKKRSYEVRVLACMAALFAVMRVCGPDRLERARAVPILVTGSDQHRLPMVECEFRQPPPH